MKARKGIVVFVAFFSMSIIVAFALTQQGCCPSSGLTPAPAIATAPTDNDGMVRLPGGAFMMGCVPGDANCDGDENPRHQVTVSSFWLDEHEVTVAEYAECVSEGVCKNPQVRDDEYKEFYNGNRVDRREHPVNGIDWNDANTYCRWRGKRLPTEAEFEFALRGGHEGYIYPWGNTGTPPARYGNYSDKSAKRRFSYWIIFAGYDDGYVGTAPVCSFGRNPYGLCDISGNAWEWVSDWYDENYYALSPANDPRGPASGSAHVLRGGSWSSDPWTARASFRIVWPTNWDYNLGVRCSRDIE